MLVKMILMNSLREVDRLNLSGIKLVSKRWEKLIYSYQTRPFVSEVGLSFEFLGIRWNPKVHSPIEFLDYVKQKKKEVESVAADTIIFDSTVAKLITKAARVVMPTFLQYYMRKTAVPMKLVMESFLCSAQEVYTEQNQKENVETDKNLMKSVMAVKDNTKYNTKSRRRGLSK